MALQVRSTPTRSTQASWVLRVVSLLVDMVVPLIILLVGAILSWPEYETVARETAGFSYSVAGQSGFGPLFYVGELLALAFYLWNKGYREGKTGKSIGKQLTGYTTVKEATCEPLGVGMGILRALLLLVDFLICYIGVLWPLWDAKRQCLVSDKATGAVVYKD